MSLKLKALGLGILAALSVSAFAAVNVAANGEGHFVTTGTTHATIEGTETGVHKTEFTAHGLEGGIVCDEIKYHGTTTAETVTSITITPTYNKCHTTPDGAGTTTVTMNGCTYTFTVAKGTTDATEQTVHLLCPPGKSVEIHHPNCTITIHAQTIETGVTYTTLFENGKHTITLDLTKPGITFTTEYHGGICVFTGTTHHGTLHGSVTVEAKTLAGALTNITAT
jgi:hypothetical protein